MPAIIEAAAAPASSRSTGTVPLPRTTKACSACSRQKLRCDGSKPCARCRDLGIDIDCEFRPSMRGKTRKRRMRPEDISEGRAPVADLNATSPVTVQSHDGHRQMWERSKSFTTSGSSNSRLWFTAPEEGRSSGLLETIPICGDDGSVVRSTVVDKLTSSLPLPGDSHNPLGVLVELADLARHARNDSGRAEVAEESQAGRGNGAYYEPLERGLKEEAPHIMNLITRYEAKQLFEAYFTHLHPHLPLLDRSHSTPGVIARRSNFLFNAICCVAARSYNVVLWGRLKEFARFEMERLPKEKNIDVVQGHLIYTWWNLVPPERFEHDMTWLRAGIAMRTAVDIALHRVGLLPAARQGLPAALLLPMIRTWLLCFITDRTISMQLGKTDGRQWEEEIWQYIGYLKSPEKANRKPCMDDIMVAYLAEWAVIVSRAVDAYRIQGLRAMTSADSHGAIADLSVVFASQLAAWRESAISALQQTVQDLALPLLSDAGERILLYERYSRLVLQSLALQYALANSSYNIPSYFVEYQTCAIDLVDIIEQIGKSMWSLRGVPDFAHTSLTYAATSLLRCTQSQFAYLAPDRNRIFAVTRRAADLLAAAATESDHIAAVQSAFVSKLISSRDTSNDHSTATTSSGSLPVFDPPTDSANNKTLHADHFEAFARTLGTDQTLTPWPPIPMMRQTGSDANWELVGQTASTVEPLSVSPTTAINRIGSPSHTSGLQSWLDQQTFSTSGTAHGQGIGELLGLGSAFSYGEIGGLDDAWWRTST